MRTVLSLVVAVTLLATACTGAEEETTLYSGRNEELVQPILDDFSESDAPVSVRYGDSAELALRIEEEGDPSTADSFYSQSPGAVAFLADRDLLAELPDDVVAAVPEEFRSDAGNWVGITGRQRVLVYNTELVDPATLPESVLDVTDMATDVAIAPANGSFQDFVTALRTEIGDEQAGQWLEAMVDAPAYASNSAIVEAVSRGEVPMGLVNHYYAYRFLEEDPDLPIANHVFAEGDIGSIVIPSTMSITAAAADDQQAIDLVAFLLSDEAQTYFATETKEYPLVEGVEPSPDIPPLDPAQAQAVDIDALGAGLSDTLDLIRAAGLEG